MKLSIELVDGSPFNTKVFLDGQQVPALHTLELKVSVEDTQRSYLYVKGAVLDENPNSKTYAKTYVDDTGKVKPVTFEKKVYLPVQNVGEALAELQNNIIATNIRVSNDSKKSD